ncbi:MAG TPA: serine/threonine-protein kinase, partial [Myxococcota bacterium]|nr:serine/threonine-protein kinase [Myxococcota bacterium]
MSTVGSGRDSRMNYPITFGKYLLLERINVGGMAEVFKAKAFGVEGFERVLAIKRILPSMADDDEFINMFVDEARIAVQLSHANIVQIYELGKYENQYYIAMEYVSGKDLRQILDRFRKRKQTLPVPAAAYLTSKICEGLDYAHRKSDPTGKPLNLIHRDVSPQNILVSYEGAVKITDFGIAKAEDRASKTQAGVLKGKFGYMSPEQVRGLEIDHRSDIFAVGILMYEMLTGKRLFIGESDFSTLEKVRNADVPPPTQHNPAITPELERVMLKALAREREERYQWTSELHDDLQQFLIEDNTIYNAKRLSGLLRQEFTADIEGELAKMEEFMRMAPPTNEKALSGARAMKNAPVARDRNSSARQVVGEKTMIFESGFSEMANAPTQISDESHDPASVSSAARFSPQKHEDHATGSVVVGKGLRIEAERSSSRGGGQVQVRQKAGRDTTMLIAAGTAFLALLIVLLVMVFKPKADVGTLIVVTTPVDRDLEVLLDGQSLGNRSPIIRDDVRLGPHSLVVRAPGYKEQAFAVNVESAGTAYHVPVNFGRPISESSGEIEVASDPPGALVIVDGKELGLTPTSVKDRDTQKAATVTVSKEGYERQTLTATFEAGKNKTRVVVTLKPIDPNKSAVTARL